MVCLQQVVDLVLRLNFERVAHIFQCYVAAPRDRRKVDCEIFVDAFL
jgi:hypothetical protein